MERAYRTVSNDVKVTLVRLNRGTNVFVRPLRLKEGREYWFTGPGVFDGAVTSEGTNSTVRLKDCVFLNRTTVPLESRNKIVSLRISRKLSEIQLKDVEKRVKCAIEQGFTILSGFISPGEKLVRDLCCRNKNAKFIRILSNIIPLSYKPESVYIESFLENRYLELAKGNEEVEFGRSTCLDLNDEIVKIATAGEGLALYLRPEGR